MEEDKGKLLQKVEKIKSMIETEQQSKKLASKFSLFAISLTMGIVMLFFVKVISGMTAIEGTPLFNPGSQFTLTIAGIVLILISLGFLFLLINDLRKK